MESNNNKSNLLKNSAIVAALILATAGVSLAIVKSNDNKKLIKNNETEKTKLVQALKDLKKANEAKSKALENQLESEKRALEGKLALKATNAALNGVKTNLNNELTNVKTELTNKDLTEAFNKLFKATPEYTTALNAYKVSQFEAKDKYKTAFNVWIKTEKDNWRASYASELNKLKKAKEKTKYNEFISKKPKNEATLPTNFNQMNKQGKKSIVNNALYNYGKEMNKWMLSLVENEYLTKFKGTDDYKKALSTFSVSEYEFIQTKAYKDALIKYIFSFKSKLEAQKTDLEGKINDKLTKSELLEAINALDFDEALKTKLTTALSEEFGKYTKSTELTTKLTGKADKTELNDYLKTSELTEEKLTGLLNNVFASKALNELDQAKLTELKEQLAEALKSKFDTLATKTALSNQKTELKTQINTKLTTSELLAEIKGLTFDEDLKAKIVSAVQSKLNNKVDNSRLSEYLKQSEFINKLIKVLDKTKTTGTEEEVKSVINQMVEDKLIKYAFDKLVQEFKGLSDISQQTGKELHNTEKTNSFYKLAPFLFESPAQANAKLNELLEGNINDKQDKLAIWKVGDTNDWIFGTLSELKAKTKGGKGKDKNDPKYSKLQKVVYQNNGWNVEGTENLYNAPAPVVELTAGEAVEKTPKGSNSGGKQTP